MNIEESVKYLQNYITTYSDQTHYKKYSEEAFIEDILYGLGVAIDSQQYSYADGYRKFKKKLLTLLPKNTESY